MTGVRRALATIAALTTVLVPGVAEAGDDVANCRGRLATVVLAIGQQPTSGDDVIVGTDRPDVIHGRGGRDVICGDGGADRVYGDSGNDSLFGGFGVDLLHGGRGEDDLHGGPHDDRLVGGNGPGHDLCKGNEGIAYVDEDSCEYMSGDGGLAPL
jgi:RTX calcium-binding nonapeptide repeat (4 copies)